MKAKSNTNQEIERLAKKLAKLVEIFRQGGKASDFKWWNENSPRSIFYPLYGYRDGQPLFESVVQGVLSLNSEMLSEHEVQRRLMYDFLEGQTISVTQAEHLNNQSLINAAKDLLTELIEFEAWQPVDIPIANLLHEGEPIEFLNITFYEITKKELEQWKKGLKSLWHEGAEQVYVLARVKSPGDRAKAISYAESNVDIAFEVLRAFCFPFGKRSFRWPIGVVGDFVAFRATPMCINCREYFVTIGKDRQYREQVELRKDILSKLTEHQWRLITRFILKEASTKMERKVRDAIHWLAESTKPDTYNSKFAKISFALETLIGGEPEDEKLQVRGITAMLAERAAFIAGRDLDDRKTIDKNIRKYYGMRSNIVHGGEGDVSLDDIDGFGELVRRLTLALLEKLGELGDEISDVEKLERWVKVQKYTLPEHNTKEVS